MRLQDVPAEGVTIKSLALDRELANEIQIKLRDLGILDPPIDGDFGPVSKLALREFAKLVKHKIEDVITKPAAQALIEASASTLLPLDLGTDFASRIVKYMRLKDYWFGRMPGYLNVVYVEGMDEDGKLNDDKPNVWNDLRIVIEVKGKQPTLAGIWQATTEPGRKAVLKPVNLKGAARIAFGQYKAWRAGVHKAGTSSAHEALVQVDTVTVHRDLNKDFKRTDDKTDVGSGFGINQHKGFNMPVGDIGMASAGCLVGRTNKGHEEFMKLVKTDVRFREASQGYKFIATVIAGDDLNRLIV